MSENNTNQDLNEGFEVEMDDATVITVPIDATLQNSNEAADAKAVGDALALKADADAVVAIKVNGQAADAQGLILIDGSDIPVSGTDQTKISAVLENITAKTAENIPMSSDAGAKTIAEVVNENTEAIENMQDKTGANIPMDTGSSTTIKAAIESLDQKTVKTVNKKGPDADGDVDMSVVPLAENLQSDKMQSIEGSFIQRTTGGNGSVSDGKAYPQHIYGHMERKDYVAESLNMTVIPMPRTEPDEPITAEIDRDTFVAYVDESGTIDLYYTTEWSADPTLYGVTVTGTPVAGDQIEIVYVKEERGTILVADPERLVATGWNLFNYNKGYAKVVKYSSEYGYKVGGGYTSLSYSATLTGERASITPNPNGLFSVPADGYVFVSGGNGNDTYILATWGDWTDRPSTGYWEPYKESGIELESVIDTYLPNGMLAIGNVRDEIDFSAKRAISRVERMTYSEENLAAAIATGRAYIYDTDYIYLVREEAVINAITIDSEYTASEHGLEYFTETEMPLGTEILYGKNLRDKLERDVVTISAQTLTAEEKAQVRKNIGAMNPPENNGTEGQLLKTNGDGSTSWTNQGTPSDAQVGTAVTAWLNAHPEATTTVQDGAISRAKLDADLKVKTDKVATLESAIAAEETERKARDAEIQGNIELEAAYRRNADEDIKSSKIPYPVSPDSKYGTSGQLLRTKGDGKTEWADVGLPTDEQTAEAIAAWLDEHPEATTTVEDGSLTEAKFTEELQLKTMNNSITPQMFGATGDGETDDTEALQDALDYAYEHDKALFIPNGTYIISKPLMVWGGIEYYTNKSFSICGENYKATVIKKVGTTKSDFEDYETIDSILILSNGYIKEGNVVDDVGSPNSYSRNGIIDNITLTRDAKTTDTKGIYAIGWINIRFSNINIEKCYSGFYTEAYNTYTNFYKCNVDLANVAFDFDNVMTGGQTTMLFNSCHVNGAVQYGFAIRGTAVFLNCSIDGGTGVGFYASKYERQNNPPTLGKLIIYGCHVESTTLTNIILCDYGNVTAVDCGIELPSEVVAPAFKVINKGRMLLDNCRFSIRYNNVQNDVLCNKFYECDKNSIFTVRGCELNKNLLVNKQRIPYTDCKELTFDNAGIQVNCYLDYISGAIPSADRPTLSYEYNNALNLKYQYNNEVVAGGYGGYQIQAKIDTTRYTKLEVSMDNPANLGSLKFAFDDTVIADGSQFTAEYVHDLKVSKFNDSSYSYSTTGKDTFVIDIPYMGEEVYLSIITRPLSGLKITQLKLY